MVDEYRITNYLNCPEGRSQVKDNKNATVFLQPNVIA